MLFPIIGNTLSLPKSVFLCLPFAGCLATLTYVARLGQKQKLAWYETTLVTSLAAISPWYFVSTGWLGYFDSWLVLCLLVTAFSPHLTSLIAVGLLAPWIDERFVLALPILIVTRCLWARHADDKDFAHWKKLTALTASASVYLVLRLVSFLSDSDPVTRVYTSQHLELIQGVTWTTFAAGFWQGHRVMWFFAVAFLAYGWLNGPRVLFVCSAVVLTLSSVGSLLIAGDMHRSLEILFPAVIAGVFFTSRRFPKQFPVGLGLVLAAALALPASHRLWFENYPIRGLTHELLRRPQDTHERMIAGVTRARQLINEGDEAGAILIANELVDDDEPHPVAFLFRAELSASMEQFDQADADVAEAEKLAPGSPDCAFTRGKIAFQRGDGPQAVKAFQRAMRLGGPDWPGSPECQAAIQFLQNQP